MPEPMQASGRDFRYAQALIRVPDQPCLPGMPSFYVALDDAADASHDYTRAGVMCESDIGPARQEVPHAGRLDHVPNAYPGSNAAVDKAHDVIALMRQLADTATIFETDIVPYWLALLEWTLPVVVFRQCTDWQKRYAACSAGLICEAILRAEPGA